MPNAGDENIHNRLVLPKKYDITLVGSPYVTPINSAGEGFSRKEFFPMVQSRYPNSFLGRHDFKKMSTLYASSKIGLNVAVGDVNMRNFEICASGTFLLTEEVNEIENFDEIFVNGKECVLYGKRDWNDMFHKIDYYLRNHEERESIAIKGYEKFLAYHTYKHRINKLLDIIF